MLTPINHVKISSIERELRERRSDQRALSKIAARLFKLQSQQAAKTGEKKQMLTVAQMMKLVNNGRTRVGHAKRFRSSERKDPGRAERPGHQNLVLNTHVAEGVERREGQVESPSNGSDYKTTPHAVEAHVKEESQHPTPTKAPSEKIVQPQQDSKQLQIKEIPPVA